MGKHKINKISFALTVCIFLLTLVTVTFWFNTRAINTLKFSQQLQEDANLLPHSITFESVLDESDAVEDDDNSTSAVSERPNSIGTDNGYEDYESEDDDEDNDNPVFRKGDFDEDTSANNMTSLSNSFEKLFNFERWLARTPSFFGTPDLRNYDKPKLRSAKNEKRPIVDEGIFWSTDLESLMPKGLTDEEINQVQQKLRNTQVEELIPPSWNQCGRPKNQLIIFGDKTRACARYRDPHHYLVDGEVLSFYLSRLLNMSAIPVQVLSHVDPRSHQWNLSREVEQAIRAAEWNINSTVDVILWVSDLQRTRMPKMILTVIMDGTSITPQSKGLQTLSRSQLVELMQWSDLIILDYITGNYDRVASMQDTADKEKYFNAFNDTVHNLGKVHKTGSLWLIDNESGLLDAYSLLYSKDYPNQSKRFQYFHAQMLQTFCIFRRETVRRLERLRNQTMPSTILVEYVIQKEPLFKEENIDSARYYLFKKYFKQRLNEVYSWIESCKRNYA